MELHLEQGDDILIVLDVGDAHAHHSRKRIYHNLIVQRMRLVLQAAHAMISLYPRSCLSMHLALSDDPVMSLQQRSTHQTARVWRPSSSLAASASVQESRSLEIWHTSTTSFRSAMRGGMAPALRMPARGSSMMSLPATLRLDLACMWPPMFVKHNL